MKSYTKKCNTITLKTDQILFNVKLWWTWSALRGAGLHSKLIIIAVLCSTCSVLLSVLGQPRLDNSSVGSLKNEAQLVVFGPIGLRQALLMNIQILRVGWRFFCPVIRRLHFSVSCTDCASFYDFDILFWNCSDNVVWFCFPFINWFLLYL